MMRPWLRFFIVSCYTGLFWIGSTLAAEPDALRSDLQPNPRLTPQEVVKVQLEALRNNDALDSGIEVTYRFASPTNKQSTGPFVRFAQMIKGPAYASMLNYLTARFDPIAVEGNAARQRVTLTTRSQGTVTYVFFLGKQKRAPHLDCWMTEAVLREPSAEDGVVGGEWALQWQPEPVRWKEHQSDSLDAPLARPEETDGQALQPSADEAVVSRYPRTGITLGGQGVTGEPFRRT